jgi:ubiquinone/menaquinone biosynthesis C-methylase UbiE
MNTAFSEPDAILRRLGLRKGDHVADLGSGAGHYSVSAARLVEPGGIVYAIDVQKDLLARLESHATEIGVNNIKTVWGDLEKEKGSRLRDGSIDVAIIANVLFQIDNKGAIIQEARRLLKEEGKVLFVDWKDSFGGMGPRPGHIVPEEVVRELFTEIGFSSFETIDAGAHHYGFIAIS